MNIRFVVLALVLAGCSSQPSGQDATPHVAKGKSGQPLRGNEPATSPSAAEAKAVVTRYFKAIDAKDYTAAWKLWGNGGADSHATAPQFAALFDAYTLYEPTVGEPTEIKANGDQQYIMVTAKAKVRFKRDGILRDQSGFVMLKRSADTGETDPEKREWRIWGTDIRVRH